MKTKKIIIFISLLLVIFGVVSFVSASDIIPDGGKKDTGDYALGDFMRIILNIYNFVLAAVGSIAFLFFIFGGIMLIFSGGQSEMVTKGRQTIINSMMGIAMVFSSFMIVDYTLKGLGYDEKVFGKWNEVPADIARIPSAPVEQALVIPTGNINDWTFDPGIRNQIGDASSELLTMLACLRQYLPVSVGRISSISDSNYIGNLSVCNSVPTYNSNCQHTLQSCHYGGGTNSGKSYAVDLGDENNAGVIRTAIASCGQYVGYNALEGGNHFHISATACPKN